MFRSLLFKLFFYIGIIIIFIIAIPALILPNFLILRLGKISGYWTIVCLKIFLNVNINVIGKENIPDKENFFVASIHQSIFEMEYMK